MVLAREQSIVSDWCAQRMHLRFFQNGMIILSRLQTFAVGNTIHDGDYDQHLDSFKLKLLYFCWELDTPRPIIAGMKRFAEQC
jgi:hypothetical protein